MKRMSAPVRASVAASLLVIAGMALGIVVDRTLLAPLPVHANPSADANDLTVESLSEHIDLSPAGTARLRALLDTLHSDVMAAAVEGPEALRAATETAHRRIESSLDPEARPAFRLWLGERRQHMMRRMHMEMLGR